MNYKHRKLLKHKNSIKLYKGKKMMKNCKGNKTMKGGKAPSCISSPNLNKYMNSCSSANLQNTNPIANYDFIEGKGVLPSAQLGGANNDNKNMQSGGSSCYETKQQQQPLSFVDYLERTSELIGGNSSNFDTTKLESEMALADGFPQSQSGGSGFSINPEEMIGGLPGRAKYDSCCQPVLMDGKLVQGKDTGAICGHQMGGQKSATRKIHSMKSNKGKKGKKHFNASRKKKTLKRNKKRSKFNKYKNLMNGGNPASYPFNGENSNFDDNPMDKDFAGKQPYWSPETR